MSLSISFASLLKNNNNGLFKSTKQADFLLSMSNDGVYSTSGNVGRNSFYMDYFCDEQGVIKVTKRTDKKGNVLTWERRVDGKVTVQDKKAISSLQRMLKQNLASFDSVSNDPKMGITIMDQYVDNINTLTKQLLELGVTI